MYLIDIIPNNDPNWLLKGDFLMYKKYQNKPIAYIVDDIVYIFLDFLVIKPITKLVEFLTNSNIRLSFECPQTSNPSYSFDVEKNILHYLFSYSNKHIRNEFQKIDFDLIKNMVEFCDRNNCHELIKNCYESVKKQVNRSYYDHYSNKEIYEYDESIRDDFKNLFRDIQISRII